MTLPTYNAMPPLGAPRNHGEEIANARAEFDRDLQDAIYREKRGRKELAEALAQFEKESK